ncbi:MAG: response regulator [Candidatus Cohnella colombiensis]|uniref:Response regulator n=1 Tax=Candidatus Cohnella colombiensis TaxID=3121368 RepID=A0AA95EYC1_9BACL|nr:MAG: response regulator [Cohnella sp.]
MKKVFLVDDEIVIRENMRNCIDWNKEGFEYCGDASDGEVALPEIERLKPDILITDIKMPFMNGLELSAIVRQRLPDTKIIILSGHDEFEFARQAIRIGVEEYCLKPFGSADIIQLLRQMSTTIDLESLDKERIKQLKQRLVDKESTSRDELLASLCNGFIASAEAIERATQLGINLIARHFAVILTDIRTTDDQSLVLLDPVQQVEQTMSELLHEQIKYIDYKRSRTEKVWVLKGESAEQLQVAIDNFTGPIKDQMENTYPCSIVFGIGGIHDRLQAVHASFLQAEEDKHWRRLSGLNKHSLLDLSGGSPDQSIFLDRVGFIEFLKVGSASQADTHIRQFAKDMMAIEWKTSLYGYYLLNDLTIEVIRAARSIYRNADASGNTVQSFQKDIHSIRSWEEAFEYLKKLAEKIWQWRSESADKYGEMLEKVKAFVRSNYGNEKLSLQDAAEHVCVSPNHLSKVFSQETGQTFIEFIMETRIRKAMELLHSTNARSYEIAYQVGYQDPHYFSNLFKRITGMNIREFRKQGLSPELLRVQEGETQ